MTNDPYPTGRTAWSVLERPDGTLIVGTVQCEHPAEAAALTTHAQRVLQQLIQAGDAGAGPVTRTLDAACYLLVGSLSARDATTAIQAELHDIGVRTVAPQPDSIRKKVLRERARRGLADPKWLHCDRGGRRHRRVRSSEDSDTEGTSGA